jgi:hypothetical protein
MVTNKIPDSGDWIAAVFFAAVGGLCWLAGRAAKSILAGIWSSRGPLSVEIGPDLFRAACQMGLKGLVSKRRDRPYQAGRSKRWLKVKNRQHPAMSRVMVEQNSVENYRPAWYGRSRRFDAHAAKPVLTRSSSDRQLSSSSIQRWSCEPEMIRRAGWCALSNVPATILYLFESISFANCLASVSVGNVLVCLAGVDRDASRNCFGSSTETNQWWVTVRLAMTLN